MTLVSEIRIDGRRRYVLIAEAALGRQLPPMAVVHHHDGNRENDSKSNLVICENQSYHNHLHRRIRAFRVTGNANLVRCAICKRYDEPEKQARLTTRNGTTKFYRHRACHARATTFYRHARAGAVEKLGK